MQKTKSFFKEVLIIAIFAIVIVWPIRVFVAQPFIVAGASMDNTFENANYLIIDEVSYRFTKPQRGDVIIFKAPEEALALQNPNQGLGLFNTIKKAIGLPIDTYYIKRIIGLPGETVNINGDEVRISENASSTGTLLDEPYAFVSTSSPSLFSTLKRNVTLGNDEYFVMGDNRHNSSDSRIWGILKKGNIKGRAFLRLMPVTEMSVFPGEYDAYKI